ncbi:HNH endonuclease [Nocardia vinacea]|uniref:HNH endonuclease n=1 Tax=Nocardia vinacea TaxID=96468 RepID=UPI002E0EF155|nr:HNH endonuclease [Nocardia vinacea]
MKAIVGVAVGAVVSGAKGGAQAIQVGTGKAYSVLYRFKLKPRSGLLHLKPEEIRQIHVKAAWRRLNNSMKRNPVLRQAVQQEMAQGQWVWHHAPERGVMELVPAVQHRSGLIRSMFHPFKSAKGRAAGGFYQWGRFFG